jgi:hypothetical protein
MTLSELLYKPLPHVPEDPIDDEFGLHFVRWAWIEMLEDQEDAIERGNCRYEDDKLKALACVQSKINEIERRTKQEDSPILAGEADTVAPTNQIKVRREMKRDTDGQLLVHAVLDKLESQYGQTPSLSEAWSYLLSEEFSHELIFEKTDHEVVLFERKKMNRTRFMRRYNRILNVN